MMEEVRRGVEERGRGGESGGEEVGEGDGSLEDTKGNASQGSSEIGGRREVKGIGGK